MKQEISKQYIHWPIIYKYGYFSGWLIQLVGVTTLIVIFFNSPNLNISSGGSLVLSTLIIAFMSITIKLMNESLKEREVRYKRI